MQYTYDQYCGIAEQASDAVLAKDFEKAVRLLRDLVQSDLPDLDKCAMCVNLGIVWAQAGNGLEALRWYDKAIQFEKPHKRIFAHEQKAAYLWGQGRKEEALAIYDGLADLPHLSYGDLERLRKSRERAD